MPYAHKENGDAYFTIIFSFVVLMIFLTVCIFPIKEPPRVLSIPRRSYSPTTSVSAQIIDERSLIKEASYPEYNDPILQIQSYADEISYLYPNVSKELILAVIQTESSFNPNATNGIHVGLMQLSTKWQADRASRLGVSNLFDPYDNILVGTCFLSELLDQTSGDLEWALMIYNGGFDYARRLKDQGIVSSYAKTVISRYETYKEESYA